jgi:DNA mismatch endonuclease (patch repair protein)
MADVVDAATRSRMMAGIRGRDTRPEWLIRRGLHKLGFRYRLHARKLPGCPDLVLVKHHAVVFIHGCFWHGHDCSLFTWPKTREDFWRTKIEGNRARDIRAINTLTAAGWRVAIVWECALRGGTKDSGEVVERLAAWMMGDEERVEVRG